MAVRIQAMQSSKQRHITPGIVYEKIQTEQNQIAHVATIDTSKAQLKLVKAQGESGLSKTSELAQAEKAILATNGASSRRKENPQGP